MDSFFMASMVPEQLIPHPPVPPKSMETPADHGIYFMLLLLILLILFFISRFEEQIRANNPDLRPLAETVVLVLLYLVLTLFSIIIYDYIDPTHRATFAAARIAFCSLKLLCVYDLIVVAGPCCIRKMIAMRKRMQSRANLFLVSVGAKSPDGYEIFSYVTDEEIGTFCSDCAICLMEFEKKDECVVLEKCEHIFHHACFTKCLVMSSLCPLCRQDCTKQ